MKPLLIKAIIFALEKHTGQEYNGGPFVSHPLETWEVIKVCFPTDINLQAASILHDTLEDTNTTYRELVHEFNKDIADLVKEVTKDSYNSFPNLKTQRGVALKFADRFTNVSHLEPSARWTEEKKHKYLFEKSKFWK